MASNSGPFGDEATPVHVMHPHPQSSPVVSLALLDRAFAFTAPFEGNVNHMYLDSRGFVTVGIGCMLSSPREAAKLPFIPSTDIAADFASVASKPSGHVASWYKPYTRCVLPQAAIKAEFNKRASGFVASLRRIFPSYDTLPQPAQIALLDMAYNLGAGALATGWPHLKAAVAAGDWVLAATQSRRVGIQPERNVATGKLFIAAHQQVTGDA